MLTEYIVQKPWYGPGVKFADPYLHPECTHVFSIKASNWDEAMLRWLALRASFSEYAKPKANAIEAGR